MTNVLTDDVAALVAASRPDPDPVVQAMDEYANEHDFPHVGPDAGQFLRVAATLVGAERVFEFGSGFGYSAAWFAPALPEDGEIYLTDLDPENLDRAREFFDVLDVPADVHYEVGDAVDSFHDTDGSFDVVFLDVEKSQYVDALDAARERLRPGGLVVADNLLAGPFEPAELRAAFEGEEPSSDAVAGVEAYVETVRDDPAFETSVVPLGEGLALSCYCPD